MIGNLKEIKSFPITGRENLRELLEKGFTGHLSRDIRDEALKSLPPAILEDSVELKKTLVYFRSHSLNFLFDIYNILQAYEILKKIIKEDYTIFLVFAGALTPADFGTSCLTPLIERGIIDCITTTGANIYHEIQRVIGGKFYEYDLKEGDNAVANDDIILADKKYSRIYNIIFPERDLFIAGDFIADKIFEDTEERRFLGPLSDFYTFTEFTEIVNSAFKSMFSYREKSPLMNWITRSCYYKIPIFCGAPQDSSLFFPTAFYNLIRERKFNFYPEEDVNEMAALQYLAQNTGKFAVIILGGGVPKNFTLQGEPYLKDICGIKDIRGFDADIQISLADVRDGGLSSCPASEGHTWGKVSENGVGDSVYIKAEVLSIFPLLVHAICREDLRKEPKRLSVKKETALQELKKAVKHRKGPMTVQEYDELINKKEV